MPIRDETGVPIEPAAAAPTAADFPAAAAAGSAVLGVPFFPQEQSQWCWAACTQMVAHFFGKTSVVQCELANFRTGRGDCCGSPVPGACDEPSGPPANVIAVYNHVQLHCEADPQVVYPVTILREMRAGRPIEVGLMWSGQSVGHLILIRGITAQGLIAVHDPIRGSGMVTYLALVTAYGMGSWEWSFGLFRNL